MSFLQARPVRLIKIDTQGFELEVLAGASETLKHTEFLIVEFWPAGLRACGHKPSDLVEALWAAGFSPRYFSGKKWVETGPRPILELKPKSYVNLFCGRRIS